MRSIKDVLQGTVSTAQNALKVNGHTVGIDVPSTAKFTDTTYPAVTTSANGLMIAADKTKLNGIATGATKNTIENNLTSTSTTNGLSAYQGKVLSDRTKYSTSEIEVGTWTDNKKIYRRCYTFKTSNAVAKNGYITVSLRIYSSGSS